MTEYELIDSLNSTLGLCMELVEERVTPAPPRLEPIVPNSGNRLKTKPFTLPQSVS
jgi:hypothetical protein